MVWVDKVRRNRDDAPGAADPDEDGVGVEVHADRSCTAAVQEHS